MMKVLVKQGFFGLLAAIGLLDGFYYLAQFIGEIMNNPTRPLWHMVINLAFANPLASYMSIAAFILASVFLVWLVAEAKSLGMRVWVYILLTLTTPFAFVAPLFLLMRVRRLVENFEGRSETVDHFNVSSA